MSDFKKIVEEIQCLMEENLSDDLWDRYMDEVEDGEWYEENYDKITKNGKIDFYDTKEAREKLREFWLKDIDDYSEVMKKLGVDVNKEVIIKKGEKYLGIN